MKKYKFSILLPHLNEGYLIDIMLDSIHNKVKYDNYEILIADDGSENKDDLINLINHPLKDKIKLYYFDSLGPSKLRKFLGEKATGDILIFSDSHMYFENDFLEKLNNVFNKKNDIGIMQTIIGDYCNKSVNGEFIYFNKMNGCAGWKKTISDSRIVEIPMVMGNSTIIKKKNYNKLGGYNSFMIGRGSEDIEFSMRAWLYGYKCYLNKDIKFIHRFRESFSNYDVDRKNILRNKLVFVYSCFQTKEYINRFLENIRNEYSEVFEEVNNLLLNEKDFWKWVDTQKKNFKYNDVWYLNKFKQYFDFEIEKS